MNPPLDVRTLIAVSAAVYAGLTLALTFVWRETPSLPGLGRFPLAHGLTMVGAALVALQGTVLDFVSLVMGQALLVLAAALLLEGQRLFFALPAQRTVTVLAVSSAALAFSWYLYLEPSARARTLVFSALVAALFGRAAWTAFRRGRDLNDGYPALLMALSLASLSGVLVLRFVLTVTGLPSGEGLAVMVLLVVPLAGIGGTLGVVTALNRRLLAASRLAQQRLAESEERYRRVVSNLLVGLVVADSRGFIELVNPAAERLFGYAAHELIGCHLRVLAPSELALQERDEELVAVLRERALDRVAEWPARRRDGSELLLEASFCEFDSSEGRKLAAVLRDVTERRELERLKNEFVSTVSHELRTPLTAVRGALGLLAAGAFGELSASAEEGVRLAERNVVRLVSLVNDILDMERLDSGVLSLRLEAASAALLVQRALDVIRPIAQEQRIEIETGPCEGVVLGDPDRLVQVLVNLLSNAVKFSPPGAAIHVKSEVQPGCVELQVRDEGRGIPSAHLPRVFDRFHRVEPLDMGLQGGTGLGLAICKRIVERHGGEIGVDSEVGHGSTFWFRVPAANALPC